MKKLLIEVKPVLKKAWTDREGKHWDYGNESLTFEEIDTALLKRGLKNRLRAIYGNKTWINKIKIAEVGFGYTMWHYPNQPPLFLQRTTIFALQSDIQKDIKKTQNTAYRTLSILTKIGAVKGWKKVI